MKKTIAATTLLATAAAGATVLVAAPANADVERRGTCAGATYELNVDRERGGASARGELLHRLPRRLGPRGVLAGRRCDLPGRRCDEEQHSGKNTSASRDHGGLLCRWRHRRSEPIAPGTAGSPRSPGPSSSVRAAVGAVPERSRWCPGHWSVVVPQAGVEPATFRLGGGCSIR